MTTNDLVKQFCYIVDGFKGELIDILVLTFSVNCLGVILLGNFLYIMKLCGTTKWFYFNQDDRSRILLLGLIRHTVRVNTILERT